MEFFVITIEKNANMNLYRIKHLELKIHNF